MMNPNSLANLEKGQQFQTGDERTRICGLKGREALTENIKARKTAKEYAEIIASLPIPDQKIQAQFEASGIKKKDRTHLLAVIYGLYVRAIKKGDVTAAKEILSLIDEQPKEETNVNMNVSGGMQVGIYLPEKDPEPE